MAEATKIKAIGNINGEKIILLWEQGKKLKINNADYIDIVQDKLQDFNLNLKPIANNFIPERRSALWYYLAFYKIFDEEPKILLNGDAPAMPYEEGVIY
jgi:hypothetical protein